MTVKIPAAAAGYRVLKVYRVSVTVLYEADTFYPIVTDEDNEACGDLHNLPRVT